MICSKWSRKIAKSLEFYMQLKIMLCHGKNKVISEYTKIVKFDIHRPSLQSSEGTIQQKLEERKNSNSNVRYNKQLLLIVRARREIDGIAVSGKESNFLFPGLHVRTLEVGVPSDWVKSEADKQESLSRIWKKGKGTRQHFCLQDWRGK